MRMNLRLLVEKPLTQIFKDWDQQICSVESYPHPTPGSTPEPRKPLPGWEFLSQKWIFLNLLVCGAQMGHVTLNPMKCGHNAANPNGFEPWNEFVMGFGFGGCFVSYWDRDFVIPALFRWFYQAERMISVPRHEHFGWIALFEVPVLLTVKHKNSRGSCVTN